MITIQNWTFLVVRHDIQSRGCNPISG